MKQIDAELLIKERVLHVLEERKVSVNKLAASFDASTRTLNDQINGSSKISAATLIALANFCQDVSAEWLLRGTGGILKNTSDLRDGYGTDTRENISELRDTIRRQQREIDGLYERIAELKGGNTIAVPKTANLA